MAPPLPGILVLGAGELGMSILHAFALQVATDTPVTTMLRPATIQSSSPEKQRDVQTIRSLNIRILEFDLSSSSDADLAAALRPFHMVISCMGFSAGPGTQLKIARAALAAGIQKFVPWQFGVDYDHIGYGSAQDLFDEQLHVRELLRNQSASGVLPTTQWKIISTGIFCSFLFEPWFGIVEPRASSEIVVRALGSWENAVTVTTVQDIARLTAEIVLSAETEWNSVTFIAGDTVTYANLVALVRKTASAVARLVQTEVWDVSTLKTELAEDPTNSIKKYRVVFAEGVGVSWEKAKTWNEVNGIKTTSVEEWLQAHPEVLAFSL
uniref:NmrA-like domain-containing protein n=1 Tax=Globisporangium ultimum (strain ATCC 200006 / CBS 805.95 / DAOM BR144) TaxID=431595 RepID=K3WEW4_GLOUD